MKIKKEYLSNKVVQESIFFFFLSIGLLVYSLYNHYKGKVIRWDLSPYLFPLLVSILIGLFSLSLFIKFLKSNKDEIPENKGVETKKVFLAIIFAFIYYAIMGYITYIPATILFLGGMLVFLGERRIWLVALISVLFTLVVYLLFGVFLNVMLP